MKRNIASLFWLVVCLEFIVFAAPPANQGYVLTWSDEFDGTLLDTNSWSFDVGPNFGGALERQYYTKGLNLTFENGSAILWTKKEDFSNCNYTSCRIRTQGKREFKYGYIEVRLKAPEGLGLYATFWTLGSDYSRIGWPICGQIDIFNTFTDAANSGIARIDSAFLCACNYASATNGPIYNHQKFHYTEKLSLNYHLYAIEWDSLGIKYFFDGNKFWEYDTINTSYNFTSFHQPHFFIANVAVYGPNSAIDTTIFPQRMYIDYVRVYQKSTQVKANPSNRMLKNVTFANSSESQFKVYDISGRFIGDFSDRFRYIKQNGQFSIDAVSSTLPQGVYVVRISEGRLLINDKLVIKK